MVSKVTRIKRLKEIEDKALAKIKVYQRGNDKLSSQISKLRERREVEMRKWGRAVAAKNRNPQRINAAKKCVSDIDAKIAVILNEKRMYDSKINKLSTIWNEARYDRMTLENERITDYKGVR